MGTRPESIPFLSATYTKQRATMLGLSPLGLWGLILFLASSIIFATFLMDNTAGWIVTFILLITFRYVRLIGNAFTYYFLIKGHQLAPTPTFLPRDVSVVIPTKFSNPDEHISCIKRILACNPAQVIVVTAIEKLEEVSTHLMNADILSSVILLSVERFDKKLQMVASLRHSVTGKVCCFADDDVQWPSAQFLPSMLASFEDPNVGACGPSQRVRRDTDGLFGGPTLCNFLGICYLERRNFNSAPNHIDGGISTLSGRTSLYRSEIIQNEAFYDYFLNSANHDDDKNLTRWTFVQGWKITLQFDPQALIETTLELDWRGFLDQCLRWARGHFRGNFRVMSTTEYWYNRHLWSLYAIYIGQWQTPALLWDGFMTYSLCKALSNCASQTFNVSLAIWVLWVFLTKIVKLLGHFKRNPADMVFIPGMILFSYLHGFLNIFALLTLHNKGWGVRKA